MRKQFESWLELTPNYRGAGRAEFTSPAGWIEGPSSASFDETGRGVVKMRVRRWSCEDQEQPFGVDGLLSGRARKCGDTWSMPLGQPANEPSQFEIRTTSGVLSARGRIFAWNPRMSPLGPDGGETTIHLRALRWEFRCNDANQPAYWALPLLNFVASFCRPAGDFDRHPLRIRPQIAPGKRNLLPWGPDMDRVIAFESENRPGFVQPLADYGRRVSALRRGVRRRLTTAVMIGHTPPDSGSWERLAKSPIVNSVRLLSLATGVEVGAPGIEFRTAEGRLVGRIHIPLGTPDFHEERTLIDELIHGGGVGALLTAGLASTEFRSSQVQIALKNLLQVTTSNLSLDDQFLHLSRSLEALFARFELAKFRTELEPGSKPAVQAILDQAAASIGEREAGESGTEAKVLVRRIANIVRGANRPDRSFSDSIALLLKHFDFADGEAVAPHFDPINRARGTRLWLRRLNDYRNKAAHGRFIDLEAESPLEVHSTRVHLTDILLRAVLKTLDYRGTYSTPASTGNNAVGLDRVTPDTPPHALGYQES